MPGVQAGAIFVDQTAQQYFEKLFLDAGTDAEDVKAYVEEALESFEAEGKKAFEGPDGEELCARVGGHKFNDSKLGVRRGVLAVERFEFKMLRTGRCY